MLCKYINVSAG